MRPECIKLIDCARFDWTIHISSLDAEQEHVVTWHLNKEASAPAEAPRPKQVPKTGVLIHFFESPHINIAYKPAMPM